MLPEPPHPHPQTHRNISLDVLRGIAVIIMVYAHAVYFFHDNSGSLLRVIGKTGNVFAFSIFLFVSATVSYLTLIRSDGSLTPQQRGHIWKRSLILFAGYVAVAFGGSIRKLVGVPWQDAVGETLRLLVLYDVPSFSEFLLPFVFFTVSIPFLRRFYRYMSKSFIRTLSVSVFSFLAGSALYTSHIPAVFQPYAALLFGQETLLRFPMLQYMPVIAFGMYWGNIISIHTNTFIRTHRSLILGMGMYALSVFIFLVPQMNTLSWLNPANRWPPSVGFLTEGLAFIFLFETVFPYLTQSKIIDRIWNAVRYMGMDSFDIYIVHMLLLFLYQITLHRTFPGTGTVMVLSTVLLAVSVLLSSLNFNIPSATATRNIVGMSLAGRYRIKKRYVAAISLMTLLLILQIRATGGTVTTGGIVPAATALRDTEPGAVPGGRGSRSAAWTHQEYGYSRRVVIRNNGGTPITKGTDAAVTFNHQALVKASESATDGRDILLAYETPDGSIDLPQRLESPDRPDTTIMFRVAAQIEPGEFDDRYVLYYGSDFPVRPETLSPSANRPVRLTSDIFEEQEAPLLLTVNRRWHLHDLDTSPDTLVVNAAIAAAPRPLIPLFDVWSESPSLSYEIPDVSLKGPMKKTDDTHFTAIIPAESIPVGEHTVIARETTGTEVTTSRTLKIFVSAPVYVAWTLDWEGTDVPDATLGMIGAFSARHDRLPVTHFFNPRIYLTTVVPAARADTLTDWLLSRRQKNGDEIALHLHMFYDMLDAIGITPKKTPRWGYLSDGYDVPMTVYSKDELTSMLVWSKNQFASHGLPEPVGFRAGGWFADGNVLAALGRTGFAYDSSGRDRSMWNGTRTSPWNLKDTSQPYHPSAYDINTTVSPTIPLLEIPNNGGNTFEYSTGQLSQRFRDNYAGGTASGKTAVIFLSHPQFADREFPVINTVFDMTDRYSYLRDSGPVVYTTLSRMYSLWK